MGNNPATSTLKTVTAMITGAGTSSNSFTLSEDKLPEGEKYLGFINVNKIIIMLANSIGL